MLYQLLDKLYARIDRMDIDAEVPQFAAQLRRMRPSIISELNSQGMKAEALQKALLTLSLAQLGFIRQIPTIGREMSDMLQTGGGEPAFRCVLAASLAYLVQPQDLLPDDLPGCYGFVDDTLLLHEACALSWEVAGDVARAEEKRKTFKFIFMFVPDDGQEKFKEAIAGLATTLNIMRTLDPGVAELTTQMLIANPLQAISPQPGTVGASPGFGSQFTNYPGSGRVQYTWKSGDSMGVNFPGGGGVATDGRDIFIL